MIEISENGKPVIYIVTIDECCDAESFKGAFTSYDEALEMAKSLYVVKPEILVERYEMGTAYKA